jgi:hypothetical protein
MMRVEEEDLLILVDGMVRKQKMMVEACGLNDIVEKVVNERTPTIAKGFRVVKAMDLRREKVIVVYYRTP